MSWVLLTSWVNEEAEVQRGSEGLVALLPADHVLSPKAQRGRYGSAERPCGGERNIAPS